MGFKPLTHYDKSDCAATTLEHNMTYYSTVLAYNNALNAKTANASSDGGISQLVHNFFPAASKTYIHIVNPFLDWNPIMGSKKITVDSRYLEIEGTLKNTSRYPYFDISDLTN